MILGAIPTGVGKSLGSAMSYVNWCGDYQPKGTRDKMSRIRSKGLVFGIDPRLGDQRDAGEFDGFPAGMAFGAGSFDLVSLAVRGGGDDEHAEIGGSVAEDEVTHLAESSDVESADKHVGARLDEPALEVAADGRRDIVANQDGHASWRGWRGWASGVSAGGSPRPSKSFFRSSGMRRNMRVSSILRFRILRTRVPSSLGFMDMASKAAGHEVSCL